MALTIQQKRGLEIVNIHLHLINSLYDIGMKSEIVGISLCPYDYDALRMYLSKAYPTSAAAQSVSMQGGGFCLFGYPVMVDFNAKGRLFI